MPPNKPPETPPPRGCVPPLPKSPPNQPRPTPQPTPQQPGNLEALRAKVRPRVDIKQLRQAVSKTPHLTFPSGLRLRIISDAETKAEWNDTSRPPMQAFETRFKGKKRQKDIEPKALKYVKTQYTERVPIVKITPQDLSRKVSKFFSLGELVKIDPADQEIMVRAGLWAKHEKFMIQDAEGNYYWGAARIDPNLCRTLDKITTSAGFTIQIDEGVRPYAYNRDMYAALGTRPTNSAHGSGRAVDIKRAGDASDRKLKEAILQTLRGKGGGFGHYEHVYHVDVLIRGKNWEEDKKSGKVHLRTRDWGY